MIKTLGGRFFNARQFAICNFKGAIILGAMLFAICQSEAAQQQPRVPRVGILFMGGKDQPHLESLKKGLGELGYSEGKNIILATGMPRAETTACRSLSRNSLAAVSM